MKIYTTNKQGKPTIVYGKQVNGHFVVVEEVRTGKSDLALFTMWKKNGRLREDALIPSSERPGALRPETISSHDESIVKSGEKVNHGVGHGSDPVPLDQADPSLLFAKGLDNLIAGGLSGVSVDENGEITVDPERFIMGLGGYTAAKALLKNPRVQTELKELVFYALGKAGRKLDGSVFDTRSKLFGGEMATGWDDAVKFSDTADRKGRFWIDDSGAKLKDGIFDDPKMLDRLIAADSSSKNTKGIQTAVRLGDVLEHEDLYKQYPEIENMNLFFDDLGNTTYGRYDNGRDAIVLNSRLLDEAMYGDSEKAVSTMLHEIQHAIQSKEGFSSGGSVGMFDQYPDDDRWMMEWIRTDDFAGEGGHDLREVIQHTGIDPNMQKRMLRALDRGDLDMSVRYARDRVEKPELKYKRLAGEQEARAVQAALKHQDQTPLPSTSHRRGQYRGAYRAV